MQKIKNIIWDWNGTLLNDIDLCISAMNVPLKKRNLNKLTKDRYLEIFNFPVIEYYKKLGFDFNKEPFEVPAHEFINAYQNDFNSTRLQSGVIEILEFFQLKDISQFILSAMEQEALEKTIRHFNLENYFDELIGIKNHLAFSKVEAGRELIERKLLNKNTTVLIGDSLHDYEVAQELEINCMLVTNGHHTHDRLQNLDVPLFKDLEDLRSKNNNI